MGSSTGSSAHAGSGSLIGKRYHPERRIALVGIELKSDSEHVLNALRLFSKHRVRVLSCVIQSHPDRAFLHAALFVDLTDSDLKPAELLARLKALPYVSRVELLDLPFTHGEARLTVFTLGDMHRLFGLLRGLGEGGKAVMYHMGFGAGQVMAERVSVYFGEGKRALEYLLLYYELSLIHI